MKEIMFIYHGKKPKAPSKTELVVIIDPKSFYVI